MHVLVSAKAGLLTISAGAFLESRKLEGGSLRRLAASYARSREQPDTELFFLGRELFAWLDGDERWLDRLQPRAGAPLRVEIRAPALPDADERSLLQAPWELLADDGGFLAADLTLDFMPFRRLGEPAAPPPPDDYRLAVAFMAASPRTIDPDLDFEAEESAILAAAGTRLDLIVEDSGEAGQLGARLADITPPPQVLHLSCHGHDAWGNPPAPVLMLEDAQGNPSPITAAGLLHALRPTKPRLMMVAACLTASAGGGTGDPMAASLVQADVPAVIGWDGSVGDHAATRFAQVLYDGLAKRQDVTEAAAEARLALLTEASPGGPTARRDWHLARVWLGPAGGGAVVGGTRKRSLLPANYGHKELLACKGDDQLVVADPAMFVGRRRELQAALRHLAGGEYAGVLLYGMGRMGKSSLAAHIAARRTEFAFAIAYANFDGLSIIDALAKGLADHKPARDLLALRRADAQSAAGLEGTLIDLLCGPCAQASGGRPVLLLLDDLERVLEPVRDARHRPRQSERDVLASVLRAFDPGRSDSRLLVTSRFRFSLIDRGNDLALRLAPIQLPPFDDAAREKLSVRQWNAGDNPPDERWALLQRAQEVAHGNPGLQDQLGARFVLLKAVPHARAASVLGQMEEYLHGGAPPDDEKTAAFLRDLSLDVVLDQAGAAGRNLLRALRVFDLPVPMAAAKAVAAAVGGSVEGLRDLGLLDPFSDVLEPSKTALAPNRLAASRLRALTEVETVAIAKVAAPALFDAWNDALGYADRTGAAHLELTRLALLAGDAAVTVESAGNAVWALFIRDDWLAAASLGKAALTLLERAGFSIPPVLLAGTATALEHLGEGEAAGRLLDAIPLADIEAAGSLDLVERMRCLFALGYRRTTTGALDDAESIFSRLADLAEANDRPWERASALGRIAVIRLRRGKLEEAMRIQCDEVLPTFKRLGDIRSVVIAQTTIADILFSQGKLDEAMRLRREEILHFFNKRYDARNIALTKTKIAQILMRQADFDAARPLLEEALASFRNFGDADSIAGTCWDLARIDALQHNMEAAVPRLIEAWGILGKHGRAEGIGAVGSIFGQVLTAAGAISEAREVLGHSAAAFRQLGRETEAEQVEALIAQLPP